MNGVLLAQEGNARPTELKMSLKLVPHQLLVRYSSDSSGQAGTHRETWPYTASTLRLQDNAAFPKKNLEFCCVSVQLGFSEGGSSWEGCRGSLLGTASTGCVQRYPHRPRAGQELVGLRRQKLYLDSSYSWPCGTTA